MKLKQITFTFENLDSITIDGRYVGEFLVDDIQTKIERTACNSIDRIDIANTFAIEIHKNANKERYVFNQNQDEDLRQMTFDRLELSEDIASIQFELEEICFEDGQTPCVDHYSYYIDWVGDSDYSNEAQSNYISKDGHLYIVIAKGKSIEDFFNFENINDSEYTAFHFSICNIGDENKMER